jgi:hypothetical protein
MGWELGLEIAARSARPALIGALRKAECASAVGPLGSLVGHAQMSARLR